MTAPHKLKIEPSAIPDAIAVFEQALDQLTAKVGDGTSFLDQQSWAGDHVSQVTAQKFNDRTHTDAMAALNGYRAQLQGVVDNLKALQQSYQQTEGNNAALWRGQQV